MLHISFFFLLHLSSGFQLLYPPISLSFSLFDSHTQLCALTINFSAATASLKKVTSSSRHLGRQKTELVTSETLFDF